MEESEVIVARKKRKSDDEWEDPFDRYLDSIGL